jgi:hypothetical protein
VASTSITLTTASDNVQGAKIAALGNIIANSAKDAKGTKGAKYDSIQKMLNDSIQNMQKAFTASLKPDNNSQVDDMTTVSKIINLTVEQPRFTAPADRITNSIIKVNLDDDMYASLVSWDQAITQYATINSGTITNTRKDTASITAGAGAKSSTSISGTLSAENDYGESLNTIAQVETLNVYGACDFVDNTKVTTDNKDPACTRGKYDELVVAKNSIYGALPVSGNTQINVKIKLGVDPEDFSDSINNTNSITKAISLTPAKPLESDPTIKELILISNSLREDIRFNGGVKSSLDVYYVLRHVKEGASTIPDADDTIENISYHCSIHKNGFKNESVTDYDYQCNLGTNLGTVGNITEFTQGATIKNNKNKIQRIDYRPTLIAYSDIPKIYGIYQKIGKGYTAVKATGRGILGKDRYVCYKSLEEAYKFISSSNELKGITYNVSAINERNTVPILNFCGDDALPISE